MTLDLDTLSDIARKATPGPWTIWITDPEAGYGGGVIVSTNVGPVSEAVHAVLGGQEYVGDTVAWHEDDPPYTRPDGDCTANIVGDSDLGVGIGDDQTARNFEFIAAFNPEICLALIAELRHAQADVGDRNSDLGAADFRERQQDSELTRLRAVIAGLVEAGEPFRLYADLWSDDPRGDYQITAHDEEGAADLSVSQVRALSRALQAAKEVVG